MLSTVDTADAANHLRDDGHVAHVRLDGGWLFKDTIDFDGGGLGLAQLLHVSDLSSRGSAVVFAAGASAEEVHGLLGAELQKTLEVLAAEAELPESALLALGVSLSGTGTKTKQTQVVSHRASSRVATRTTHEREMPTAKSPKDGGGTQTTPRRNIKCRRTMMNGLLVLIRYSPPKIVPRYSRRSNNCPRVLLKEEDVKCGCQRRPHNESLSTNASLALDFSTQGFTRDTDLQFLVAETHVNPCLPRPTNQLLYTRTRQSLSS